MPRGNRYIVPGCCHHLTHRCHNREFLLKFARDRDQYQERLRRTLAEVDVGLLQFTVTSNHIHLLLAPSNTTTEVSRLMQRVQGQHALSYNKRRERHGAFWEDRYHVTMVESGLHLWRCLAYIDLNMVRAGQVTHPREWPWTGYHELMGLRRRYRQIDLDRVVMATGARDIGEFRQHYAEAIEQRLTCGPCPREPAWTETLAVGTLEFVDAMSSRLSHRRRLDASQLDSAADLWTLRELPPAYEADLGVENRP